MQHQISFIGRKAGSGVLCLVFRLGAMAIMWPSQMCVYAHDLSTLTSSTASQQVVATLPCCLALHMWPTGRCVALGCAAKSTSHPLFSGPPQAQTSVAADPVGACLAGAEARGGLQDAARRYLHRVWMVYENTPRMPTRVHSSHFQCSTIQELVGTVQHCPLVMCRSVCCTGMQCHSADETSKPCHGWQLPWL